MLNFKKWFQFLAPKDSSKGGGNSTENQWDDPEGAGTDGGGNSTENQWDDPETTEDS